MNRKRLWLRLLVAVVVVLAGVGSTSEAVAGESTAGQATTLVTDPAALVNPMIGTKQTVGQEGNAGNTFPGPAMPFGMVQWGPDTSPRWPGGDYDYGATALAGFGMTRMSGAGCGAYGDLPFLPVTGTVPADKNNATVGFTHAQETARTGYYGLTLANNVRVELTTGLRSGLGRFTFPAATAATLLIKAAGGAAASEAGISAVSTTEVTGWTGAGAFCARGNHYRLYYAVKFDKAFTASSKWTGQWPWVTGDGGIALTFPAGTVVKAKVGISFVSVANAQANRDSLSSWDLAVVEQAARTAWNGLLTGVQIGGGTLDAQKTFYTALYHSLLHPNVFSDSNGQYIGFDKTVRTVPAGQSAVYANFSGWDTYRSQLQLSALVAPAQTSDMVRSLLLAYDQSGRLPKWPVANGETFMMVGDPALPLIASAYAFGARNFDTAKALTAMVDQATGRSDIRPGTGYLDTHGYLPTDGAYDCCEHTGTVSTSLEYGVADFALSAFAAARGDRAVQAKFLDRAQGWQYLLNPQSGFIQPRRSSGVWKENFDPTDFSFDDWAEGNSWKYTPMVPFNAAGLISAKGGAAAMSQYLDTHFQKLNEIAGPYAWMGNEPSFGTPWLYNYTGQPYKTQQVVRRIQTELFGNKPDGLAGNDDLGSLSSWYVWSALGLYPAVPGTADLVLGSPVFPEAAIRLQGGKTLTISAPAAAAGSPYVQSMSVNGADWNKSFLPPGMLSTGGAVTVALGSTPNTGWASTPDAAPPSYSSDAVALANSNGTSNDAAPGEANYDQFGSGYSVQALQATGVVAGSKLVAEGIDYVWPNVRSGRPDNVLAAGQTVTVSGPPGANRIGFLGSSEGSLDGAAGAATITYADGTSQQVDVGFSDWTLAGGAVAKRSDNVVAADMPYRNNYWAGGPEQVRTYLYSTSFAVDPAKTVISVTLPATPATGRLHIFDIGFSGHRANAGVSDDTKLGTADFDNGAAGYSRQALAAAGLTAGRQIVHNGVQYVWPATAAGDRDNYVAQGQSIPLAPVAGATKLGLMGAAEGWPTGVSGSGTVVYTDGTRQAVTIGFTDWTRGGGGQPIGHGNTVVAQMPYRHWAPVGTEQITTYVYATTLPLTPGKTPQAIELPPPSGGFGRIHVFAAGTG
ncbi:GH92 family glycosyl hydrolase [Kribbella sp. C-35]|uniref:GH92 family glycosyl hydrolase n=1 Tax=Kribbella sp. C-35 TaxID=2789276 RepID=UPI00397DD167